MNYLKIVNHSKLRFVFPKIATSLLRGLCKCAESNYAKFDSAKVMYNKNEVVENLTEALASALSSLVDNTSPKKQKVSGWSHGFICGHVQGELSVLWTGIYVIETSKEFSDIVKSRAMSELLYIDDIVLEKFGIVYDYYNITGHNAVRIEEDLPSNVVLLLKSGKKQSKNREIQRKEVTGYFRDLFVTGYRSMLREHNVTCCPDLTDYITEEELIGMIGKEHFACFDT